LPYFFAMMFLSDIIGLLTAVSVKELGMTFLGVDSISPPLSLIVGYAGGDFIENIYKIIVEKPSLYFLPEDLKKDN